MERCRLHVVSNLGDSYTRALLFKSPSAIQAIGSLQQMHIYPHL